MPAGDAEAPLRAGEKMELTRLKRDVEDDWDAGDDESPLWPSPSDTSPSRAVARCSPLLLDDGAGEEDEKNERRDANDRFLGFCDVDVAAAAAAASFGVSSTDDVVASSGSCRGREPLRCRLRALELIAELNRFLALLAASPKRGPLLELRKKEERRGLAGARYPGRLRRRIFALFAMGDPHVGVEGEGPGFLSVLLS